MRATEPFSSPWDSSHPPESSGSRSGGASSSSPPSEASGPSSSVSSCSAKHLACPSILPWRPVAHWVWNVPLGWFPRTLERNLSGFVGQPIPLVSLILIFGCLLGLTESIIAPIEVASLLANVMSYTRLAGLGIGKAAIAAAFNTIILEGLIRSGQIGLLILGVAFLVLAQLLVFLLGWISAGIQALRLNYVEAFIKFFKGNGTPFRPFGARTTSEV